MRIDPTPSRRHVSIARSATILAVAALLFASWSVAGQRPGGRGAPKRAVTFSRPAMVRKARALLADPALASCLIGVEVRSLRQHAVLLEQNSRKLFHPASNMKLLTTATALHRLPAGYRFVTAAGVAAPVRDSVVQGDLIVSGMGDPLLMPADLDTLARTIFSSGIRSISGNIVGDVSRFDTIAWGKGWMWDDDPGSDYPFLTPLSVHHNTVSIRVTPAPGGTAQVTVDPPSADVSVVSDAVVSADTLIAPLDGDRVGATNRFRLFGRIAPDDTARVLDLTVWRPAAWLLSLLRDRLRDQGVRAAGELVVSPTAVPIADTLARVSHALAAVVDRTNKESDNLAAELLLKTLGAESFGAPGSARGGLEVVKGYLQEAGADTSDMTLADGSGVSWYTVLSPGAIGRLLQYEYDQKATFGLFRGSLPLAGIDGTLQNRMKGTRAERNAAAKTGTLTGEACLSGYVTSADGAPLAFSILCNHYPGKAAALRNLQNALVELLAATKVGTR